MGLQESTFCWARSSSSIIRLSMAAGAERSEHCDYRNALLSSERHAMRTIGRVEL